MVLFRDFAKRKAEELDVFGWVKNLEDGSVQLVAQGEKEKLDKAMIQTMIQVKNIKDTKDF